MKASKIDGRIFAENLRKKVRQAVTQLPEFSFASSSSCR